MRRLDLTGQRFGKLLVLERAGHNSKGRILWRCRCDCGNETQSKVDNLTRGIAKSCGCVGRAKAAERMRRISRKHGHTVRGAISPEYRSWACMIQRCKYPYINSYKDYGGRGIKVCERWQSFENFLADMGSKPTPNHSIDRYLNIDGDYEPGNCRWATPQQQASNTSKNHYIDLDGQSKTVAQWAREKGIQPWVIHGRLKKGWTERDAVMRPLMKIYKTRKISCETDYDQEKHL